MHQASPHGIVPFPLWSGDKEENQAFTLHFMVVISTGIHEFQWTIASRSCANDLSLTAGLFPLSFIL